MRIYLAGGSTHSIDMSNSRYCLESFYTFKNYAMLKNTIPQTDILIDSGAFTFMNGGGSPDTLDAYLDEYIAFCRDQKVTHFFELDVDVVKGLPWVERARTKLENATGRQCIPVWHRSRGMEYYKALCREYSYIAIGGLVTKEIMRKEYAIFEPMLAYAKEHNCKVHGLGLTNFSAIKKYRFYSVDSTSWTSGHRFGTFYRYKDGELLQYKSKTKRVKTGIDREIGQYNWDEWCKYQRWADIHL